MNPTSIETPNVLTPTDDPSVAQAQPVSTNRPKKRRDPRSWHLQVLVLSVVIVALAMLLQVRADQRVYVTGLSSFPIPESCGMQIMFGQSCPGCGLTRSFIHLAHGDWQRSFAVHRIGWIVALLVAFQIPYRLLALYHPIVTVGGHWGWIIGILVGVAMFVNWFYNLWLTYAVLL